MRDYYCENWSMSDKMLITAVAFLSGMVMGFLFSPVKRGINCDNNNGYLPSTAGRTKKK